MEDFFAQYEFEFDFPEFEPENPNAYFEFDGESSLVVYGSSYWNSRDDFDAAEMQAYAALFDGWDLNINDYGDCYLTKDNAFYISFVGDQGCFSVNMSYNPVQMEFPLDEINDWLDEYMLGFELTEALPDPAGKGYKITYGTYLWFPYVEIDVQGDAVEAMLAVLDPIVTAAGYEFDEEEGVYYNDYEDMVQVSYDADADVTFVIFMY